MSAGQEGERHEQAGLHGPNLEHCGRGEDRREYAGNCLERMVGEAGAGKPEQEESEHEQEHENDERHSLAKSL
jgi:hypothetical protein